MRAAWRTPLTWTIGTVVIWWVSMLGKNFRCSGVPTSSVWYGTGLVLHARRPGRHQGTARPTALGFRRADAGCRRPVRGLHDIGCDFGGVAGGIALGIPSCFLAAERRRLRGCGPPTQTAGDGPPTCRSSRNRDS